MLSHPWRQQCMGGKKKFTRVIISKVTGLNKKWADFLPWQIRMPFGPYFEEEDIAYREREDGLNSPPVVNI